MGTQFLRTMVRGGVSLAVLLLSSSLLFAQRPDSAAISKLLDQVKLDAVQATNDAERMESYTRSRASWQSHADRLNSMKEHINSMGKDLAELSTLRAEGSPWQQEAIDRIEPILRSMADHLTAMIEHLSANQSKVHLPPYVAYVTANVELSNQMLTTVKDFLAYGEARAKVDALEGKLELPSEPGQ